MHMRKAVQDIKLHHHTCLVFSDKIEFFHCLIPFVAEGLKNNERSLIVIDEITKEDVLKNFKYLFKEKLYPLQEMQKGAIIIESCKNVYFQNGTVNSQDNLAYFVSQLKKAVEDGYKGLRVFAEISKTVKESSSHINFLNWEQEADKHFDENGFLAICAYNKKYFSDSYLSKMIKIHPIEIDVVKTRL